MRYPLGLILLCGFLMSCSGDYVHNDTHSVICTEDARQCPDGSWVGRTGPKCEFVCPK